jgi:ABC-2 type transport system permease protein
MTALLWTVRYEALMASRRKVVWGTVLPLALLSLLLAATSPVVTGHSDPAARVGAAAVLVNTFCTLGIGLALTDRLRRAREEHGMPELLSATPAGALPRAVGGLAGPLLTALTPVAALLLLHAALVSVTGGSPAPLGTAATALLTVIVPATVLVTAFGGLLGALLPVTAARAVLVVAWLWACHFAPAFSPVPTPTGTVLSPLGGYPLVAWAHAPPVWAAREGTGALRPAADDATALLNLTCVLTTAVLCHVLARLVGTIRRHGAS